MIKPIMYEDASKSPFSANSTYAICIDKSNPSARGVEISEQSRMTLKIDDQAELKIQIETGSNLGSGRKPLGKYSVHDMLADLKRKETAQDLFEDDKKLKFDPKRPQYWWTQVCCHYSYPFIDCRPFYLL
jgi:hypothetical protein